MKTSPEPRYFIIAQRFWHGPKVTQAYVSADGLTLDLDQALFFPTREAAWNHIHALDEQVYELANGEYARPRYAVSYCY